MDRERARGRTQKIKARCAKCAFVAAALGAFFDVGSMQAVFGDDVFEAAFVMCQ